MTDKITWSAILSWYRQNYISSSASSAILVGSCSTGAVGVPASTGCGARHDNVSAQQLSLTYTPYRWLLVDFIYHHEERSSNNAQLGYDDNIAQVGAKLRF